MGEYANSRRDVLTRVRAVENALFLVGVNRVGRERSISFPGRSIVVDPLGMVIARRRGSEGIMTVEVDLDDIPRIRRTVTYFSDRTPNLDASLIAFEKQGAA
jgi:predicted amidohydrolase